MSLNDALLVTNPYNIFYLSHFPSINLEEREAYLLLTASENFLLTDGRYLAYAKKSQGFKALEITPNKKITDHLSNILNSYKIKSLGIEEHDLKYEEFLRFQKRLKVKLIKTHEIIEKKRQIKSKSEIENIKKAAKITDLAFDFIKTQIKENITEKEIADKIIEYIRKNGADIAFPPIVAFGKNSAIPHYQTGNTKLKSGDIILLDFGAKFHNYCSDITRTLFFKSATYNQKGIYQAVLKAQEAAIKAIKPNIKTKEIDKIAKNSIKKASFLPYKHSLGHGLGLQAHEKPSISSKSKDILKPNMVITIEPGIYNPGIGGIRIEDLLLLTKKGPGILTRAPKKLTVIS